MGHGSNAANECADIVTIGFISSVTFWRGGPSDNFKSKNCFKKTVVSPRLQCVCLKRVLAGSWSNVLSPTAVLLGVFFRALHRCSFSFFSDWHFR